MSGWELLKQGNRKEVEPVEGAQTDLLGQAFYPMTLPLTTGPGTIAVMISLGLSNAPHDAEQGMIALAAALAAIAVMALTIFWSFAYADRLQRLLGPGGTDIAVRLSAFILFCLGVQIIWSGASELLASVVHGT
jgi:multiple antibiotic resistance protein